jgi:hypothetical protein
LGWPYWGGWGLGWDPWWYDPFWYNPWPAYSYYPGYGYDPSDDPPYNPDSFNYNSPENYLNAPSSNADEYSVYLNSGGGQGGESVQNKETAQPGDAPNSPGPAAQPQTHLISQSKT